MAVSSAMVAVPVAAASATSASCSGRRREERGGRDLLEVALGDGHVGVVGGDDLALLGELEAAVHRARGLGEDRAVRRPAAAPDGAAAPVEQRQRDAVAARDAHERLLGPVEQPVRGEEAALLGRVGVAEHDLLGVAAGAEVGPVGGIREQRVEQRRRRRQRVGGLEERHDVEHGQGRAAGRRGRASGRPNGSGCGGEAGELQHVGDVLGAIVVKLMTYRRQASTPKRAWIRAMDRNVARTSATVTPAATSSSGPAPVAQRLERRPVDRGVLADLERGEVEAEGGDLPAQVRELAVRHARQAVGDERVLEHREVRVERRRRRDSRRSAEPSRR